MTATIFVVTTLVDENTLPAQGSGLSLREAIAQANLNEGVDTIVFAGGLSGGLIRLTLGELTITDAVTIDASGIGGITITGDKDNDDITLAGTDITDVAASGAALLDDNSRIFNIQGGGGSSTFYSLTLTGGRTTADGFLGGAILALGQSVTFVDCTVSGNSTDGDQAAGGGIAGIEVELINSTVSGNSTGGYLAGGGGIVGSEVELINSTVSGNSTAGDEAGGGGVAGGIVYLTDSTVSGNSTGGNLAHGGGISAIIIDMANSTVSGNSTGGYLARGGGIFGDGEFLESSALLYNSTVSGNATTGELADGGGVYGENVTLTNSTVSGNAAAGVNSSYGGILVTDELELSNSIVLGNDSTTLSQFEISVGVSIIINGLNIVGTGADSDGSDGIINADPTLVFAQTVANGTATAGVLADNGGPVQTIALKLDLANPAVDAGSDTLAPTLDARGAFRFDAAVAHNGANTSDLGAFEAHFPQTFVVTTANDELDSTSPGATIASMGGAADLSLREAIFLANQTIWSSNIIVFDASVFTGGAASLVRLTLGEIEITTGVTIDGSTATGVTITGDKDNDDATLAGTDITNVAASGAALLDDNSRIFNITSDTAATTLQGLTLTGGRTTADLETGGAIRSLADLTLIDSTVSGNSTAGNNGNGGGIAGTSVTLINSTVSGNSAAGGLGGSGGGIFADSTVVLIGSTVSGNSTAGLNADGGGIAAGDTVTLTDSTVSGNKTTGFNADGGGIFGTYVTLTDSTVSGNSTEGNSGDGGGIFGDVSVTLTNSTVSGNSTADTNGRGGGIRSVDTVTLTNSTVSGNSTAGDNASGGGIWGAAVELTNSTVSGNSTSGASANSGGIHSSTVTLTNSIVLGNNSVQTTNDEISAASTLVANGLNIVGTGADADGSDGIINANPVIVFAQTIANGAATAGVLANNGGPVQTIALTEDIVNPALDAATSALLTDARGLPRSVDLPGVGSTNTTDLGAFEVQVPNDPPALTGVTSPVTFLENTVNAAPQLLDADVTFADPDDNFNGGTLTVTGLLAEDSVAIRNQGIVPGEIGVSGSNVSFGGTVIGTFAGGSGATLTVTFNASATSAAIEALIENLTYANSSNTPTASRTLTIAVADSVAASTNAAITVNVTAENDAPVLSDVTSLVTFLENTVNVTPQLLDADVTFTDAEGNFNGGGLMVTGLLSEDSVAIRNQGTGAGQIGISGGNISFGGTVIGTFTGGNAGTNLSVGFNASATPAAIEALIENLTYANSSNTPTASRTLTIVVADSVGAATNAAIMVNVTAENDPPALTGVTSPVTFLENTVNATPQLLDADVTLTDPEGNFDGGTLTVTGLLAEDSVAIRNQGVGAGEIGVSGSDVTFAGTVIGTFAGGSGATLTVTFNASATVASIEALIENLTYANVSNTPTASRILTVAVTDSAAGSTNAAITVNVTAENDAPALSDVTSPVTFLENTVNLTPQLLDADVTLTDPENNFDGGALTVSGLLAEDTVSIRNQGNGAGQIGFAAGVVSFAGIAIGTVTGGAGTALIIALNAAATAAAIEALIENLTYANASDSPTASRTLTIAVADSSAASTNAAIMVDVTEESDIGVTIIGSNGPDLVDAGNTVPGQPLPTNIDDTILGGKGDDDLSGLFGVDTIDGGKGNDTLRGDGGHDILQVKGSEGKFDIFDGGPGNDTLQFIGNKNVTLAGFDAAASSIEILEGNGRNLNGTGNADFFDFSGLTAMTGINVVDGKGGDDILIGSDFDDNLRGSGGADRLDGRGGSDFLKGNGGPDTFVFADGYGSDTALDYKAGQDIFDFTGVAGVHAFGHLFFTEIDPKTVLIDFDGILGGDTLTVQKTTIAQLDANQGDFLFS